MTKNQIDYQKLQLSREEFELAKQGLNETIRHNTVTENETYRSNMARENETTRHNTAVEDYNTAMLFETQTHNRNTERETERSNKAREAETYRSNVAREQENFRHNTAVELETAQHNRQTESLGWATLAENSRANQVREAQNAKSLEIQGKRTDAEVSKLNVETAGQKSYYSQTYGTSFPSDKPRDYVDWNNLRSTEPDKQAVLTDWWNSQRTGADYGKSAYQREKDLAAQYTQAQTDKIRVETQYTGTQNDFYPLMAGAKFFNEVASGTGALVGNVAKAVAAGG